MNIQVKKLELIEWIAQISDDTIIDKMDKIRRSYISFVKSKKKPMTLEDFYASIYRAEEDIKNGRIYTQEEVEMQSENW